MALPEINGHVAPGFEAVYEAFLANFEHHGEVGAACALYSGSERVVDLWGGCADPESGRPWQQDSLQLVFSATKGATVVCLLRLVERGEIDLDAPVATYWPEFAAAGKELLCPRDGGAGDDSRSSGLEDVASDIIEGVSHSRSIYCVASRRRFVVLRLHQPFPHIGLVKSSSRGPSRSS